MDYGASPFLAGRASEAVGQTAAPSTHFVRGAVPTAETGFIPEKVGAFQRRMEASFTYQQPLKSSLCYCEVRAVNSHEIHRGNLRGKFGCLKGQGLFPEKFTSS